LYVAAREEAAILKQMREYRTSYVPSGVLLVPTKCRQRSVWRCDTWRGYGGAAMAAGENQWRWPHLFFSQFAKVRNFFWMLCLIRSSSSACSPPNVQLAEIAPFGGPLSAEQLAQRVPH
jgi:hypothetical protein